MKEADALDLAIAKYGLLKGARLIAYASQLYARGALEFDRMASQPQRSKMLAELREAGVDFDRVEWGSLTTAHRRLVGYRDRLVTNAARRTRPGRTST